MKSNTHIAVVLDRSGSMEGLKKEIIGGFNAFLEDQKEVKGTATLTLVQFDNEIDRLADFKPLSEVKPLTEKTYVPRGCTRLYDAIGLTCNTVKESIEKLPTKIWPDKVLVVILTDGLENASQEYDTDKIKELLEERQKAGWQFTFIGANQDAILTARGIGLHRAASNISYAATVDGTQNIMRSMSAAVADFRCADAKAVFAYKQGDRDAQAIDPVQGAAFSSKAIFNEHNSKGGTARAASMTAKERSKVASNAAKARWSRKSV